jgi:hypothetical protein
MSRRASSARQRGVASFARVGRPHAPGTHFLIRTDIHERFCLIRESARARVAREAVEDMARIKALPATVGEW